nr:2-oxoglutarate and iron-dependent oxygenase domain-containing protein [Pseudomonas sp. HS-2]
MQQEIPVIDIGPFRDNTAPEQVVAAVRAAATDTGFLYIKGHGVSQALVDRAFAQSQAFFALPDEVKQSVKINSSHRGYMGIKNAKYSDEVKPNLNETFLMGFDLGPDDPDVQAGVAMHGPNQWPAGYPEFRATIEEYHAALLQVGRLMLRIFARALELPENFFEEHFRKPMPFVRLLHYPPQPHTRAEDEFGIAPHTDYGFLTILAQDEVGGLQVKRRDGGWIDAPFVQGTFVVNIADMLMQWTNDKWVSTPHRVINTTGRERYSIPFFFDPTYHTVVECIPSCRSDEHPAKYSPITWGDYLKRRFDEIYAYRKKTAAEKVPG